MILAKGLLRVAFLGLIVPLTSSQGAESQGAESQGAESQSTTDEVSYYRQVLPILQTHCQGCHQPARRGGEYDMTDFSALLKGGESDERAILPGNADASYLLQQITPDGDQAEMPKGKPPLASAEIELIKKWIGQGAKDDTPAGAKIKYDTDNPPRYDAPPMITALDYSSDGKWLAVSGFHEVLLHEALLHEALHHEVLLQEAQDGSTKESVEPVARLIGMSERIESVVFSPDSAMLAVTGGTPGRMGEVQVWEIATRKLLQSIRVSFDTIRGASWSPDGKQLSFGCTDNTVRVIEVSSGKQVLYSASHTDWVLGTVFSAKGDQLVTCSRDGSVKLVEVKSQRMLGGLTGVQPGALKDDLHAVALHPTNNEVVAAGQDGIPTSFRLDAKPNGSKVRDFQRMPGRIFDIRFSRDGQKLFAGSSDKGSGHVFIYNSGGQLLKQAAGLASPVYAIACSADGKLVASGGADGVIRLNDVESGELVRQFVPIKLQAGDEQPRPIELTNAASTTARETLSLPDGLELESIVAFPESIQLKHRFDYRQLLLTGRLTSGEQIDLTRIMKLAQPVDSVIVSPTGVVRPAANGAGELVFDFQGKQVRIPTEVVGLKGNSAVSYIRDVQPMLSKLGCNAGTCHGSKDGKNGFKLSLRGYDPQFDHLALTDDLAARRINIARPERSLMMLKPTGISPHVGGVLMKPGQPSFELLRQWIRDGSKLDLEAPRVTSIDLLPKNPVLPRAKMAQQMIVMATYSDGSVRDVSAEAVISSGDIEVIQADSDGLMITLRRGESPVLARYEGSYTATTITVMGDRSGFTWQQLPVHNYIDPLVDKKLQRVKVAPSDLCTDAEFIRRVFLDLTGLPPNAPRVATFLADKRPAQQKRDDLVDDLVSSGDFIEHWTNKWADLLQVNRKFLGVRGSVAFRGWIKQSLSSNKPYDQFVYQILNAQGSTLENPPAAYYKVLREPTQTMENTTHLFLGVRFNCNKCHDHPFERWTQSQYYHLSAYFAQIGRKKHPVDADVEMIYDTGSGEVRHLQTGQNAAPEFPYSNEASGTVSKSRREELARWITSPKNAYFAKSYVNRLWGYMFGVGIIEPIDDIRAGNPATNPELLDALTKDFIESGFDVQHILKTICKSRTYQLSVDTNKWNSDDQINYSHAKARRLPAEVLYDAIHRAAGAPSRLPGVPTSFRAAQLPDTGIDVPFLTDFGRPPRESACECERVGGLMLGPIMKLINGPTVAAAINDQGNDIHQLIAAEPDNEKVIEQLFLRFLARYPTQREIDFSLGAMSNVDRQLEEGRAKLQEYQQMLPAKQAAWEKRLSEEIQWSVLEPESISSSSGATLAKQDDLSILVSGKAEKDVYTLSANSELKEITGLRLEVLPDDSLPNKGPGRAADGNFILSEIRLRVAPQAQPDESLVVELKNPTADYSQAQYEVQKSADNNAATGWAIASELGKPHQAIYEAHGKINWDGSTRVTIELDHQNGTYTLGRFRLAVTSAAQPLLRKEALPPEIAQIVQVKAEDRDQDQNDKLLTYYRTIDADSVGLTKEIKQLESLQPKQRTTGAQDLMWALINSSAFLFNR